MNDKMRLATMFAIVAMLFCAAVPATSAEPAKIRITTWNLEWFPNGSANDAPPKAQAQRIQAA
jgi:hypothetical protein